MEQSNDLDPSEWEPPTSGGGRREGGTERGVFHAPPSDPDGQPGRIEVKGRKRGQPIRLTTNEWLKAQQLADTYWLSVVWDALAEEAELVSVRNPAQTLDHAKREIVATRFYEIPAQAIGARNGTNSL